MAWSDLTGLTPGSKDFGKNLARTQRLIAKALLDWCEAQAEPSRAFLPAISFDKLAEVVCRLWDQLQAAHLVRQPTALFPQQGFHGPGRALRIDRTKDRDYGADPRDNRSNRWAFTTELVGKLSPAMGRARAMFIVEGDSWKDSCRVRTGLDPSEWDSWLAKAGGTSGDPFLSPREATLFGLLSKLISGLSSAELRSLGTHSDAEQTISAIEFNRGAWRNSFFQLETGDYGIRGPNYLAYRLVVTAQEIRQKADRNRDSYVAALRTLLSRAAALQDGAISSAIRASQKDAAQIWQHPTLVQYREVAPNLLSLSRYFRMGLSVLKEIRPLSAREQSEAEVAGEALRAQPHLTDRILTYQDITVQGLDSWRNDVGTIGREILVRLPRSLAETVGPLDTASDS